MALLGQKKIVDSNFFLNCLLKSTLYDGLCGIFEKKSGRPGKKIQVARQSNFLRKKMLGLYQNMKMRHRLAPNFVSSFS